MRKQRTYNEEYTLENLRGLTLEELSEKSYYLLKEMKRCEGTKGYYTLNGYRNKVLKVIEEK